MDRLAAWESSESRRPAARRSSCGLDTWSNCDQFRSAVECATGGLDDYRCRLSCATAHVVRRAIGKHVADIGGIAFGYGEWQRDVHGDTGSWNHYVDYPWRK